MLAEALENHRCAASLLAEALDHYRCAASVFTRPAFGSLGALPIGLLGPYAVMRGKFCDTISLLSGCQCALFLSLSLAFRCEQGVVSLFQTAREVVAGSPIEKEGSEDAIAYSVGAVPFHK